MMLEWLGQDRAATLIRRAVERTLAAGHAGDVVEVGRRPAAGRADAGRADDRLGWRTVVTAAVTAVVNDPKEHG